MAAQQCKFQEGNKSMNKILVNPVTNRLRAGWRILMFFVLLAGISAVGMIAVRTILGSLPKQSTLQFSILAVTATLAVYIARRFVDKKPFISLGLSLDKFALLDVLSGVVNSALLMTAVFFTMLWADLIEFHGLTWWMENTPGAVSFNMAVMPVILIVVYKFAIVAWWEELAFRGYFFQNLVEGTGPLWAIIISSLVFGFGHAINPEASFLSSVLIAFVTPQLIYAYLKTGQLWLPIGLHLGWNFFQASVFGFASSGQDSPSLISQSPLGPEWLSGGEFGAEGSLLIIPFTALSCVLIHFWVRATRQPGQKPFGIVAAGALFDRHKN